MSDNEMDELLEWDEDEIKKHVKEMEDSWEREKREQIRHDRPVIPAIPADEPEEVKP